MPKGTTLTSYNPSLRDKLAWALSDMFGGGDRSRVNYINEKVRGAADLVPGVGDVLGVDDTQRAFREGNYGEAALNAATTAVGAVPGGGDLLAAGLKGAGGALGILAGPSARGWRKDMADKATDMIDQGRPPNDVWLETGMWKHPKTGELKFEIPDTNAAVHPDKRMQKNWEGMSGREALEIFGWGDIQNEGPVPLGSVLTHPELFENYPELKNLRVEDIEGWSTPEGAYRGGQGLISARSPSFINPKDSRFSGDTYKDTRSTMLHEIQHAIQDREGWDPGFNPSAAAQTMTRSDSFATQMYWRAIAEAMQKRGITPTGPEHMFDFSMTDEAQKLGLVAKVPYETYQRNVGETEARNIQNRAEMDPMLRVAKNPSLTMDRYTPEQLTWQDIVSGSFDPEGVPGLSLRGPAKRRPMIEPIINLNDLLGEDWDS